MHFIWHSPHCTLAHSIGIRIRRPTRQTTFLALLAYAVYLLLLQPPLCGSVSVTEGKADVWRRPRPWPRHHSNAEVSSVFEFSTLDAAEAGSPRSLDDDIDGDNFLTDIIYAFIFGGKAGINGQTGKEDPISIVVVRNMIRKWGKTSPNDDEFDHTIKPYINCDMLP